MAIKKIDHVGIIVQDLELVKEFFSSLGLELMGQQEVSGDWINNIYGVDDAAATVAMMNVPNAETVIEIITFKSPQNVVPDSNYFPRNIGGSHIAFAVQDLDQIVSNLKDSTHHVIGDIIQYKDQYKLCYIKGPESVYVELAEKLK